MKQTNWVCTGLDLAWGIPRPQPSLQWAQLLTDPCTSSHHHSHTNGGANSGLWGASGWYRRVAISNGTVIKPGWSSPLFYKEVEEKPFWCGEKRTGKNKAAKGHFSPVVLGGIVVNFQFLISITDQLQFLKHCCISQHHVQQQKGPCEPPQSMFACKSDIQPLGLSEGSSQS